jgi:hypothetical protein
MAEVEQKLRHAWLRALGKQEMPETITLADGEYLHLRTFKHDFFAATGLYDGPSGKVVLKIGRAVGLFGLPLSWIGRYLADHEMKIYEQVDDLTGIPKCLGRWDRTGFAHAFVEGHPLQKKELVDDEFFSQLKKLIEELHTRDIAYVDLEKRENILVDDKGRPCLIDFQISWQFPRKGKRTGLKRLIPGWLGRFILDRLQQGDRYHLLKHQRRHRPDTMTEAQIAASRRVGWGIRLHRLIARPLTLLRRRILKALTGRSRSQKQDGPEFMNPPR